MIRSIERAAVGRTARRGILAAIPVLLLAAAPVLAEPPSYTMTYLGSFGTDIAGYGINNQGHVVGATVVPGTVADKYAFISDGATSTRLLPAPAQTVAIATDINNNGILIGSLESASGHIGILYDTNTDTVLTSAANIKGNPAEPLKLNDSNQIAGTMIVDGVNQAFFHDGSALYGLGLNGQHSWAYGLNNLGQVIGQTETANGDRHGLFFDGVTLNDLGTFLPTDINDNTQLAGSAPAGDGTIHAFLYDSTGAHDLGTLLAGAPSGAHAINNSGWVAGWFTLGSCSGNEVCIRRAILHDGTALYDLNDLIDSSEPFKQFAVLYEARAINDSGEIVANACIANGDTGGCDGSLAFLLKPAAASIVSAQAQ